MAAHLQIVAFVFEMLIDLVGFNGFGGAHYNARRASESCSGLSAAASLCLKT